MGTRYVIRPMRREAGDSRGSEFIRPLQGANPVTTVSRPVSGDEEPRRFIPREVMDCSCGRGRLLGFVRGGVPVPIEKCCRFCREDVTEAALRFVASGRKLETRADNGLAACGVKLRWDKRLRMMVEVDRGPRESWE